MSDRLEVVAALIGRRGRFLMAQRVKKDAIGPVWEFPGGRVEAGETLEEALARELREELGIETIVGGKLFEIEHDYPDIKVRLHFFSVEITGGEPEGLEGQALRWADRAELAGLPVPEADRAFVRRLGEI